eukprot:184403-Chlamydomonas_euryale.AAC.1
MSFVAMGSIKSQLATDAAKATPRVVCTERRGAVVGVDGIGGLRGAGPNKRWGGGGLHRVWGEPSKLSNGELTHQERGGVDAPGVVSDKGEGLKHWER